MNTAIIILSTASTTVMASAAVFLLITLALVVLLLVARHYLVPQGKVKIDINNGTRQLEVDTGSSLLNTLHANGVMLSSACGGKGSCGQCRVQVVDGGGEILPTEAVHFSRREQQDHWRLGCQVKVKNDMNIALPASVLSVKDDIVPPTINHDPEDKDEEIDYNLNFTFNQAQQREVRAALSNTFGFGGHNACAIFKKYK